MLATSAGLIKQNARVCDTLTVDCAVTMVKSKVEFRAHNQKAKSISKGKDQRLKKALI